MCSLCIWQLSCSVCAAAQFCFLQKCRDLLVNMLVGLTFEIVRPELRMHMQHVANLKLTQLSSLTLSCDDFEDGSL